MTMKIRIRILLVLLCLLPIAAACGDSVTLEVLRGTVPESIQFTIDGTVYDVPVILPEADSLPILLCQSAVFDTTDLRDRYPLEGKHNSCERIADAYWNYKGSPLISYNVGKSYILYGSTDSTKRGNLPIGETPPENDLTPDDILAVVYDRIAEFHGDSSADIRICRAVAMSGLYHMKSKVFKAADGSGVSYRMPVIDESKPVKSASKGLWDFELTQYFHSIPVFPDSYSPAEGFEPWPCPIWGNGHFMDESTMSLNLSYLTETEVLAEDTALAPFSAVVQAIENRIQSGQLKTIYQITLGYTVFLPADADPAAAADHRTDVEYLLLPTWQICGYDLKDRWHRYYQGFTTPDRQTVMQDLDGRYALRLDAASGEPVTQLLVDLSVFGR